MARNKVNLKMQMLQKLDSQAAFGVKKQKEIHGCDKQYNSNRNVNGIASYKTMEKYKSCCSTFCDWIKSTHPEVRTVDAVTTDVVREYVEHRAETCSNWTISADVSALNRACHSEPEDRNFWKLSDFGDYRRRAEDVVNNRNVRVDNHQNHLERNADAILLARAFGFRRSSLTEESPTCVRASDLIYAKDGHIIGCPSIEKGGKLTIHYCLEDYRSAVEALVERRVAEYGENATLCETPTSNCNIHQYRQEFCRECYREQAYENSYLNQYRHVFIDEEKLHAARNAPRWAGRETYKGYNLDKIAVCSALLSHNRLEIVFSSYRM